MLFVLAGLLMMQGCEKSNTYTITGTVDDADYNGRQIYLLNDYYDVVDSALIENCSFTFTGTVEKPYLAELETMLDSVSGLHIVLVVEPGEITATITHEDVTDRVGGTLLNDRFQVYKAAVSVDTLSIEERGCYDSLMAVFYDNGRNAEERNKVYDELQRVYEPIKSRNVIRLWDLYHNNEENVLGHHAINQLLYEDTNMSKVAFLDSLIATTNESVSGLLAPQIKKLRALEATSEGKQYTNINGIVKVFENGEWKTTQGSLKDLVDGKPAVVDFWASWCGPCRHEIKENLIALSEKYKGKAVVVGVDVWDSIDLHAKSVADMGVVYPQLIDTTSYSTDTYGIEGIPEIMVVDSKGVIVERGLRGPFIEAALLKALNE